MYFLVRLLLGFTFGSINLLAIRRWCKTHKRKKYVAVVITSVILIIVAGFIPFENAVWTFDSPEAAFEYFTGNAKVKLVVEGKKCDLVVGDSQGADTLLIIPKTDHGWKIGTGSDIKYLPSSIVDDTTFLLLQYRNSSEYFITVLNTKGGEATIFDSCKSRFYFLERWNSSLDKSFITYFAYVPDAGQQYWISVDGKRITFLELSNISTTPQTS